MKYHEFKRGVQTTCEDRNLSLGALGVAFHSTVEVLVAGDQFAETIGRPGIAVLRSREDIASELGRYYVLAADIELPEDRRGRSDQLHAWVANRRNVAGEFERGVRGIPRAIAEAFNSLKISGETVVNGLQLNYMAGSPDSLVLRRDETTMTDASMLAYAHKL